MPDIGVLPRLVGQGWSIKKTPTWQTRVQRSASGRELRVLDYPYPLWRFELTWAALGDNLGQPGNTQAIGSLLATDLRTLMGFFLACQGAFGTFLYDDPTDDIVVGQQIAVGDGTTQTFQFVRTFGPPASAGAGSGGIGFTDQIGALKNVSAVYLNGIRLSNLDLNTQTAQIVITPPPSPGVVITADFGFYFRCRFMSDAYEFENFMARLWSVKKLDFISVRP